MAKDPFNPIYNRDNLRARAAALSGDSWIATYSPIEPHKLHAMGYISYAWNACEQELLKMFGLVFAIPEQTAWTICHDMGDVSIANRIKAHAKLNLLKQVDLLEAIMAALDHYQICRVNRNSLMHAYGVPDDTWSVSLVKQNNKAEKSYTQLRNDLWSIRRVGRETKNLRRFMILLNCALLQLRMGKHPPSLRIPSAPRSIALPAQKIPIKRQPQR